MTLLTPVSHSNADQVRAASRNGFRGVTAGCAPTQVQANLLVLPARYADDFRGLCKRNPVACPLLGENEGPGTWTYSDNLAEGDIRYDAPGYNIYNGGKLVEEDVADCAKYWSEDSVAFLIGCSYTFEAALTAAGLPPRHQEVGRNVPMYKTKVPLCPSGVFNGCMVVSMRPYRLEDVEKVRDVTRPYFRTHGEPVAWGVDGAAQLGIADVNQPDFGDSPVLKEGEVPVFWGCGVSPQLAVMSSKGLEGICIGHAPGRMICLDLGIDEMLQA